MEGLGRSNESSNTLRVITSVRTHTKYLNDDERQFNSGCPHQAMLGAALEASLLAMAKCYAEEVEQTKTYSSKKEPNLDKWNLIDHLKVARELNWIPSKLPLDKIARESGIDPGRGSQER